MPRRGYKQTPEHKAKLARVRTSEAIARMVAARIAVNGAYMKACAERYGFETVEEYKVAFHQDYAQYRQARRKRGRDFLSFEDYLLARANRAKPSKQRLVIQHGEVENAASV